MSNETKTTIILKVVLDGTAACPEGIVNVIDETDGVVEVVLLTNRQAHEEAAGMGLEDAFFTHNNIDPDAPYIEDKT